MLRAVVLRRLARNCQTMAERPRNCQTIWPGQPRYAAARTFSSFRLPWQGPAEPERHILRLLEPANLLEDADQSSSVVAQLPRGEFVITASNIMGTKDVDDSSMEWLLVRSSLEEDIAPMSETPLQYQDGWLFNAKVEIAELQLGQKVAARVSPDVHPFFNTLRKLPAYSGDAPLPSWLVASVSEMHKGKIGGVVKNGQYLVQRGSGAIPERIQGARDIIFLPKQRKRITGKSALLGLLLSTVLGCCVHSYRWIKGERFDVGHFAYAQLIGWTSLTSLVVTPFTGLACYIFANTQASTACVVMALNLLFYEDLFGQ